MRRNRQNSTSRFIPVKKTLTNPDQSIPKRILTPGNSRVPGRTFPTPLRRAVAPCAAFSPACGQNVATRRFLCLLPRWAPRSEIYTGTVHQRHPISKPPNISNETPELAGLPAHFEKAAQGFFTAIEPLYGKSALSVGGDAVLAARWDHRQATRIEVYGDPEVLTKVYMRQDYGQLLQEALRPVTLSPLNTNLSYYHVLEHLGQFEVLIGSVPIQVLMHRLRGNLLPDTSACRFPGTSVGVWKTTDILADKLRRTRSRLETRRLPLDDDLQDFAAAHAHDKAALNEAFRGLPAEDQVWVCEALRKCEPIVATPEKVADFLDGRVATGVTQVSSPTPSPTP